MVGDDRIDAPTPSFVQPLVCDDSAVCGQDDRSPDLDGPAESGFPEIVSVPKTVRYKRHDAHPEAPEPERIEGRGAHSVHVVIPVDEHGLPAIGRAQQPIRGGLPVREEFWRVEMIQERAEVAFGRLDVAHAPRDEKCTDRGR
jgi:hypothetical protein